MSGVTGAILDSIWIVQHRHGKFVDNGQNANVSSPGMKSFRLLLTKTMFIEKKVWIFCFIMELMTAATKKKTIMGMGHDDDDDDDDDDNDEDEEDDDSA
jgi:hypothetical protein